MMSPQDLISFEVHPGEAAVWWHDGEPDYKRYMAKNTPYADWYASL